MTGPLSFEPLFKPRVWGGRALAERYGKALPPGPIGESWEVVDRPEEQSVVDRGELAGTTLHELWTEHRTEIFGARGEASRAERFPLLVKLLDAEKTLSVQVHPPADIAAELGGTPKTEMWVLLQTAPGARLFAGLRRGVTREAFTATLEEGDDVSQLLHQIPVRPRDVLNLPSGRVHAIGAGCVIAEIQQNSDTTYRVFDFNRPGLDGEPRELHTDKAMRSIDWDDIEPGLVEQDGDVLVSSEFFTTSRVALYGSRVAARPGECAIVVCVAGVVECGGTAFGPGRVFIAPASEPELVLEPAGGAPEVLIVELP